MQRRNVSKLEVYRKKQEEVDERLRAAGIWEEDLTENMKTELLQCLEASRESARAEEEMQQSIQWEEQRILTKTMHMSSIPQRSNDDSGSSSKRQEEEEDVVVTAEADFLKVSSSQQPGNQPSTSCCIASSIIESQDDDEDLFLLKKKPPSLLDRQAVKSSTKGAAESNTKDITNKNTKNATNKNTKNATNKNTEGAANRNTKGATNKNTEGAANSNTKDAVKSNTKGAANSNTKGADRSNTKEVTNSSTKDAESNTKGAAESTNKDAVSTSTKTQQHSVKSLKHSRDGFPCLSMPVSPILGKNRNTTTSSTNTTTTTTTTTTTNTAASTEGTQESDDGDDNPHTMPATSQSPQNKSRKHRPLSPKVVLIPLPLPNSSPQKIGLPLSGMNAEYRKNITPSRRGATPVTKAHKDQIASSGEDTNTPTSPRDSGRSVRSKVSTFHAIKNHLSSAIAKGSKVTKSPMSSCTDSDLTENTSSSCSFKNTNSQSPGKKSDTGMRSSGDKPLSGNAGTSFRTKITDTPFVIESDTSSSTSNMSSSAAIKDESFLTLTRESSTPAHKGTTSIAINNGTSLPTTNTSTSPTFKGFDTLSTPNNKGIQALVNRQDTLSRTLIKEHGSLSLSRKALGNPQQEPALRRSSLLRPSSETPTTITSITSEKEIEEVDSHQPTSPLSDSDEKVTLRTAMLRPINVFSRRGATSDVLLQRQRPLSSEHASRAFHRGLRETLEQCRQRIMALMDSASRRLQQHQASLAPLPWQPPITVHPQLKNSLDRPRPASRSVAKQQCLEEEGQVEEREFRRTRRTAQGFHNAPEPLRDPSRSRGATVLSRPGQGRTRGLRGYRRPSTIPLPKVSSDSDTDLESGPPWPSLPKGNCSPSPQRAEGTVLAPQSQSQQSLGKRSARRTLILNSDSESSGAECRIEAGTKGRSRCVPTGRKDTPSSPTASPDLCIIEEEEEEEEEEEKKQQKQHDSQPLPGCNTLALDGARRVARRGRRRPTPGLLGEELNRQRKRHALHTEDPAVDSIPQQATCPLPETSGISEASEHVQESNAEEGEERQAKEEKVPCPICQKLFELKQIEVHASDCMGIEEEESQEKQHHLSIHGPKRQKKMSEESGEFISERSQECSKKQMCNSCGEEFKGPEDRHLHIRSCQKKKQEGFRLPSYAPLRAHKRRDRRGHGRTPRQAVATSSAQDPCLADNLPDIMADPSPSPEF